MKKFLISATAAALLATPSIATADSVTGTIASIDGALQVIRLDNGAEFKLGTFNTTGEFRTGDRVTVDWSNYMKGYMLADRVRVESRKTAPRAQ